MNAKAVNAMCYWYGPRPIGGSKRSSNSRLPGLLPQSLRRDCTGCFAVPFFDSPEQLLGYLLD